MILNTSRLGVARAASVAVAVLLVLGLTGCRTARLSGNADPIDAAASVAEALRIEERGFGEAEARTWVRTKASYERVGVDASRWAATAAPAPGATGGDGAGGGGGADLAKQSQNPIANMISLPFQNNTSFGIGPYDRTQNVTNINLSIRCPSGASGPS